MSSSNDHKMTLKLVVDKKRNKVIYAEAKKDFVDLLIYLLSLPLSAVVKYSTSAALAPCCSLVNLHSSVESIMKAGYIKTQPNETRWSGQNSILVPQLFTRVPVLPPLSSPNGYQRKTLYICKNSSGHVTNKELNNCGYCGFKMDKDKEVDYIEYPSLYIERADYVKDMVTFMVADDLSVSTLDTASVFAALKGCDPGDMVEKEVEFGTKEVVELLNATLLSDSPLTSVFLKPK